MLGSRKLDHIYVMHTHVMMCACVGVYVCVCISVCLCAHTPKDRQTLAHTYSRMYTPACVLEVCDYVDK